MGGIGLPDVFVFLFVPAEIVVEHRLQLIEQFNEMTGLLKEP